MVKLVIINIYKKLTIRSKENRPSVETEGLLYILFRAIRPGTLRRAKESIRVRAVRGRLARGLGCGL